MLMFCAHFLKCTYDRCVLLQMQRGASQLVKRQQQAVKPLLYLATTVPVEGRTASQLCLLFLHSQMGTAVTC